MTDREIIRALRICSRRTDAQTCAECPLFDSEDSEDCMGDMMVGAADLIERLEKENLQLTLSVSLHAPTNAIRSGMMPVNDAYPVEQLMQAVRRYQDTTGRRVSF